MTHNHDHHSFRNEDADPRSQRGPRGRRGPRFDGPGFDPGMGREAYGDPRSRSFDGHPGFPGDGDGPFRGPEGPGPRGSRHGGHRGPRGGRAARGDVRTTILRLLSEEPMHGYQLMQTITERSGGRWTPSPGAIYPTLSALADEGLITLGHANGRKLATLTEAGAAYVSEHQATWSDPFVDADASGVELPALMHDLHGAVRHAARAATPAQLQRIAAILTQARSDLYSALAEQNPGQETS
jgi:DNA-binding PadR family transcriptional regulator